MPDITDSHRELFGAIRLKDVKAVRAALKAGADPNGVSNGQPILIEAAQVGNLGCVKALVGAGAKVNIRDEHLLHTPLHRAAMKGHQDVVEFLVANGADRQAKTALKRTPMDLAARQGHWRVKDFLESYGRKGRKAGVAKER